MRGRNLSPIWTLLLVLLLCGTGFLESKLSAQPLTTPVNVIPDCLVYFDFTANASSAQFDNRFIGCKTWYVAYTSTGFPALTLTFESAPDNNGAPGAWVAFAGAVLEGVNPNVALTEGSTIMYGYYPWQRLTLTGAVAGAGRRIRGTFYGYRQTPVATVVFGPGATVTADQGAPNTAGNRWPVYLSDGANPWGLVANPFFTRLSDGAAAQGTQTNPLFGRLSDGANPFGTQTNPLFSRLTDGTNPFGTNTNPIASGQEYYNGATAVWTPVPACTSRAVITLAGAGTAEIVALSGAMQIRVCHLSLALSGASNITVVQGTGVNCATGPTNVTGAYQNILGLALDFEGRSLVALGAGQALCITNSAAVTGGGFLTYSQY